MFWLKKLISTLMLPLPLGLLLISFAIFLFAIKIGRKTRRVSLVFGWLILLVFSFSPVSSALLNQLQGQYTPLLMPPDNVTQIVVLGGGVNNKKDIPPNLTLGSASLSRLVEGVRLYQLLIQKNPNATLILSGGRVFESPSVAGKMRNTAVMLGVDEKHIVLEDGSRDTQEEALYLQKMLGQNRFILVTSAFHMPRAMQLFESLGMHPIAAPTQYLELQGDFLLQYLPNATSLVASDIALHEYLGIVWSKLV